MRTLTSHKVDQANDTLEIIVNDKPGSGGACHHYTIKGFDSSTNPSDPYTRNNGEPMLWSTVLFQNGPINEFGVNGVTHEALLAIVIDRLESFQKGPYANDFNAKALSHCNDALASLKARTRERVSRGVEGTHKL